MNPNGGGGEEVAGSQPVSSSKMYNTCSCAHGAQINLRDLTPYLTYAEIVQYSIHKYSSMGY
jgi:hypothetical protein